MNIKGLGNVIGYQSVDMYNQYSLYALASMNIKGSGDVIRGQSVDMYDQYSIYAYASLNKKLKCGWTCSFGAREAAIGWLIHGPYPCIALLEITVLGVV